MLGSVFVLRRVTATNMTATKAQAKVHPAITHLQAFFTTLSVRFHITYLIEMCTLGHGFSISGTERESVTGT